MIREKQIRKLLTLITIAGFLAVVIFPAKASLSEDGVAKAYETLYSTVRYAHDDDVYEFGRKIGTSAAALNRDNQRAIVLMKENLDRIVYRVKAILDMYPPGFHFNIYIYPTYNDIKEAYKSKGIIGKAPIAFYSFKSGTIYVSLENITDRILAHEIAHAVINAYFETPPPEQMQEILAQYVDKHLWDDK